MPRLQTFEGEGLESVLARVRSEIGQHARVLEAKKVRSGGLGGFFSRERYVLIVEVPDEPTKRPKRTRPLATAEVETAPPSSILELADLMSAAEARELVVDQERPTMPAAAPMTTPVAAPAPGPAAVASPLRAAPVTPVDFHTMDLPLVRETARVVHVPTARLPEPIPSTESESFQDVLGRLAAEITSDEEDEVIENIDVSTLGFEHIDIDSIDLDAMHSDETDTDPDEEVVVQHAIDTGPHHPAVPQAPSLVRVRRSTSTFERTVGMGLLELGVPAGYIPDIERAFARGDLRDAVMTALRLPKPPALPLRNNAIVAVVGERRAATDLADQLADEPALNGAIVKIADRKGFTLIGGTGPSKSAKVRGQRPTRTIVAVPSAPGVMPEWTRELLDDLEPDMVWGVVPAASKSEDIASWAIGLGGLDVLALTGVHRTVSPATSLRLGIPIGLLDGECATAEAWADLLTARLAA